MVSGRCMKEKISREIKDPKLIKYYGKGTKPRYRVEGLCSVCGTKMSAIIGESTAQDLIKSGMTPKEATPKVKKAKATKVVKATTGGAEKKKKTVRKTKK